MLPRSWQLEQAAAVTALCTMAGGAVALRLAKLKELKFELLWHRAQSVAPMGTWVAGSVTIGGAPTKDSPEPWQPAQLSVLTAAWFIGGLLLLMMKLLKVVALWQLSQAAEPIGM